MAEVSVQVVDRELAGQVLAIADEADVSVVSSPGPDTALAVIDPTHLAERAGTRLGPPRVLAAWEVDDSLWGAAADAGVDQIVSFPGGAGLLAARLRALRVPRSRGRLVRVIGVRGGCGATTTAVGLAQALRAEHSVVVLVDGDPWGPGLQTPLGFDDVPGIRWPDLADIRGQVPADTILGRLPSRDGLAVLSHLHPEVGQASAWSAVVGSLLSADAIVVADVPQRELGDHPPSGPTADVLVTPLDMAGLTCARRLVRQEELSGDPMVLVRRVGGPVGLGAAVSAFAGLTVTTVPQCRGVVGAADFGDLADAVTRGAIGRFYREVVAEPLGVRRRGAA